MRDLFVRYIDGCSKLFTDVSTYGEMDGTFLIIRENNITAKIPSESIREVRIYD